jgi:LDH2 family malate/lactate/ureidoglycolate dehydrogenase
MLAEVLLAHRLGRPLPDGVAWDGDGRPTTTPLDVIGGAVTAWGGHKGSGLALVVQMLGMLTGASAAPVGLTDCGLFLVVIDPAVLGVGADYAQRVAEYADSVRSARLLDPQRPVLMPFDRSAAARRRRLADGHIEVDDHVHADLLSVIGTVVKDVR